MRTSEPSARCPTLKHGLPRQALDFRTCQFYCAGRGRLDPASVLLVMATSAFSDSAQKGGLGDVVDVPVGEPLAGQGFRIFAVPNDRFGRLNSSEVLVPAKGFEPPTP